MEVRKTFWKQSIHLPATKAWAIVAIGQAHIRPIFRGDEWIPSILNPKDWNWIELRRGVTREQVLQVWVAIGQDHPSDDALNQAAELDRQNSR